MENSSLDNITWDQTLAKLAEYLDVGSPSKIVNRLTDYAEIINEGKLAGIVNFNYQLTSTQVNEIIDLLIDLQAVSVIYNLALKGTRDLEKEFVSNLFSDYNTPQNISSYISLRTTLENRLSHQLQQYNMNMGKTNNSQAMSINELKGHVRTYRELLDNNVSISTKAQHGVIAASLHDAYVLLMNREDWRNDRTYMKFFFNEEDVNKSETLLVSKKQRQSLKEINQGVESFLNDFNRLKMEKKSGDRQSRMDKEEERKGGNEKDAPSSRSFSDRMLMTPFGQQYGKRIDSILEDIFSGSGRSIDPDAFHRAFLSQFDNYSNLPDLLNIPLNRKDLILSAEYLLSTELTPRTAAERYLYNNRRESLAQFYSGSSKELIDSYYHELFKAYFEDKFEPVFRIIRSGDMKKFACAYIMKRVYFLYGENLNSFGYLFLKTISREGGIKSS
jgi:hypothetical protein